MKKFIEIKDNVISSIDDIKEGEADVGEVENDFYCLAIISHLENKYLPFCFLWASFSLKFCHHK